MNVVFFVCCTSVEKTPRCTVMMREIASRLVVALVDDDLTIERERNERHRARGDRLGHALADEASLAEDA